MSFGGSAFGKTASAPSFGAFGNANTQSQPGTTSTTGPFGSFGGSNQQSQGQNQQPGATNVTGNSLFPPPNTGTNPLFGSKPPGQLFGNSTQPTTTPAFGGGSAFGAAGSQSAPNAPSTFGAPAGNNLFGSLGNNSASQPTAGTSLFGQQTQQTGFGNQPSAGTGLFGQQTQPQTNQGGQSNGPTLFGQQPQQSAPSLFGQPLSQPQQQQQQPQQQQQQQQSGPFSAFGQSSANTANNTTTGTGLFGNNQPGSSLFGISNTGANTGASTSSLFGPRISTSHLQPPGDSAQAQYLTLVSRIEGIAQAWDPSSPQCRFQHFFYNLVDPSQVHMYGRPPNAINDASWQKAIRENPDPSCYVPALAVGFDDLQKRVEAQKSQAKAHQEKLKELKTRIATLSSSHSSTNSPRLQRAAAVQTQLQQRLVRLVQHLHLLIPSVRSSSIRPEEEALRSTLESLEEDIRRPSGVGRLKGKLSELWAVIGAIEAARERDRKNGENNVEWAVVDQEGLQRLAQILSEQQNGIAHLTKIVQGHQKDLDVILGKAPQEREPDAFSNPQASQVLLGASLRGAT